MTRRVLRRMTRRVLRATAALVLFLAVIVDGSAAFAQSPPPPPPPYSWVTTCAVGAFTSVVPNGTSVHLEGWIRPCSPSAPWNARWSLAEYRTSVAYADLE